ncbi:hypothetical protein [Winogradskyella forsetii]|uniref:hypothetical protein n=1 Tax=Winogradskyella forsetii TaxID=2686077 RepID=UPI0015BA4C13|nr:hypothetical protein [Winogradskyella forsetii]
MLKNYTLKIQNSRLITQFILLVFLMFSLQNDIIAQNDNFETITTNFENYSEPYREIVYSHLNKSILIKGEMLGFSNYILKKDKKTLSKISKNLYCVITDSTNTIIKSKLIKVKNGFANNVFNIDSLFTTGHYTFKAYTNWMKNFDEQNAFIETFKVIDPQNKKNIEIKVEKNHLDAQFLPEGGNFIDSINTNVGVIIKNNQGFGVPNIDGIIYDKNDNIITSFKTNTLGIGTFILKPKLHEIYKVEIKHLKKTFTYKINDIKPKGISIIIKPVKNYLAIELITNNNTLADIKNTTYKLVMHNGKSIKYIDIEFNETSILKQIDYKTLFTGINIFTLFNQNNKPILERLYFNYDGINLPELNNPIIRKQRDSIKITLNFKQLNLSSEDTNISVSVLPENTKSYLSHHNIISYTYLQPYLKGYIENASYYFQDITNKKKYDLDKLLITQGWSSYDWHSIIHNKLIIPFVFEDGIVINANNNNKENSDFIIYPLNNNEGYMVNLDENENGFMKSGFFPLESEQLKIGAIGNKSLSERPNLYLQFSPTSIPKLYKNFKILNIKEPRYTELIAIKPFLSTNIQRIQQLSEVTVTGKNERLSEIEKFKNSAFYNVDIIDDNSFYKNLTLVHYLNTKGFSAYEQSGSLRFLKSNVRANPVFYLDGFRLNNTIPLISLFLNNVEFIAINRYGFGTGMRDQGRPVVQIYSKKGSRNNKFKKPYREYEFPLTFSENKKFYAPIYSENNSLFFHNFGVIDWIPNCTITDDGDITFNILNTSDAITLFIEGIAGDGNFLSITKNIAINN